MSRARSAKGPDDQLTSRADSLEAMAPMRSGPRMVRPARPQRSSSSLIRAEWSKTGDQTLSEGAWQDVGLSASANEDANTGDGFSLTGDTVVVGSAADGLLVEAEMAVRFENTSGGVTPRCRCRISVNGRELTGDSTVAANATANNTLVNSADGEIWLSCAVKFVAAEGDVIRYEVTHDRHDNVDIAISGHPTGNRSRVSALVVPGQ